MGLTDHIKDITSRLAGEGYAALALDIFSAGNTAICIWKCLQAVRSGKTDHFAVHYLQSGLDYLAAQPFVDKDRLGAIGFCMGGNFALSLACLDKRIKTIAPFYGLTPSQVEVTSLCRVVGSYPTMDATTKSAGKLAAKLDETSIAHDIKFYPGAVHCFMNDRLPLFYKAQAASDSWQRTLSFFAEHLRKNQLQ